VSVLHPYPPADDYPEVPDLVCVGDLADLFGVSAQWPYSMRTKGLLPEPDGYLGRNPYWIRDRIADWWKTNPNKRSRK
jgi:hypothetical protein